MKSIRWYTQTANAALSPVDDRSAAPDFELQGRTGPTGHRWHRHCLIHSMQAPTPMRESQSLASLPRSRLPIATALPGAIVTNGQIIG